MDIDRIHWLGHASFRIDGSAATIYIDPWKLEKGRAADLVLVTHEHFDHLSVDDIRGLLGESTLVAAPAPCREPLEKVVAPSMLRIVAPSDVFTHAGVEVRALWAYNTQADRQGFHPRDPGKHRLGYLVTVDGTSVYHTGDTDSIPEMEGLAPDVVLLPVGGTYTMTAEQAADAARRMGARAAIPMHYGDIVGTRDDALRFASLFGEGTHVIDPE